MDNKKKISQLRICAAHPRKQEDRKQLKDLRLKSSPHEYKKLRAAFLKKFIWPENSNINIYFLSSGKNVERTTLKDIKKDAKDIGIQLDPLQNEIGSLSTVDAIKKIVNERYVPIIGNGIKISFVDNVADSNIRIAFDSNDGAWSMIGTDCLDKSVGSSDPTMNFGWMDVATVTHEFGHAFGMLHEHQNSIGGNPIEWDKTAVYNWASSTQGWDKQTTDDNILNTYDVNTLNGSSFDPLSIMLYFFPASLTTNNQGTHQNLRLSGIDVTYLEANYPNGPQSPADFYQEVYGESIDKSITDSATAEVAMQNASNSNTISVGQIVWILVVIVLIILIIHFFSKA